ncbi:MAG: DUF3015 family protein [SAR324 cluster bacterium]|nr:DUF3015 family protein [SAR324 cluster bacterium]
MKKTGMLMIAGLLMSSLVYANSPTGCGIPSHVLSKDKGISGALNFIINITTSFPLYASSTLFGTSNCQGLAINDYREDYVRQNYVVLMEEASQGSGYHWEALSQLAGCQKGAVQPLLIQAHESFEQLFVETAEMSRESLFLNKLKQVIEQHPQLSGQCQWVS